MATTEVFLIALTIILSVPWLVWRIFRTDYWAPLVVVQIVGGILLGPGVLGAAFPQYYAFVFSPPVIGALAGASLNYAFTRYYQELARVHFGLLRLARETGLPIKLYGIVQDEAYFRREVEPHLSPQVRFHGPVGGAARVQAPLPTRFLRGLLRASSKKAGPCLISPPRTAPRFIIPMRGTEFRCSALPG